MLKTIFSIFFITLSFNIFATAQYPDNLIYNGENYSLHTNPLEGYFKEHPEKKPKGEVVSTALWRGYIATFEIDNNELILKDIVVEISDKSSNKSFNVIRKTVKNDVFSDNKRVLVDWFSGLLVIPYGKMVEYVHMGYASSYENYIILEIDKGVLKKEKKFNIKEFEVFKERQFIEFKKTDEYKKLKEDFKKKGSSDEFIDSFLKINIIIYTTKIL
ncbi:hypothetical protein JXR93_13070 [bacterium]|nr:hypothetical protein [bacterium]